MAALAALVIRQHALQRMALDLRGDFTSGRSELLGLVIYGLILVGSAWLFFGILEDVVTGDPLVLLDEWVHTRLQSLRSGPFESLMLGLTELGDTPVVIAVLATAVFRLCWGRFWRSACYLLAAVAGASLINTAIKVALHRPRPAEMLYSGWSAYSFPSGHSTVNLVLYGFLAVLIGRGLGPTRQFAVLAIAILFALMIAFSRLYLGAHWLSDVLGGLAFGTAWMLALAYLYRRKATEHIEVRPLVASVVAALAIAGVANIYAHHATDLARYAASQG